MKLKSGDLVEVFNSDYSGNTFSEGVARLVKPAGNDGAEGQWWVNFDGGEDDVLRFVDVRNRL